jgi:hypothetical protein
MKQLHPHKSGPKQAHKINPAALLQAVAHRRDAQLVELAAQFKVTPQAIWYALKRLGQSCKKNVAVRPSMYT